MKKIICLIAIMLITGCSQIQEQKPVGAGGTGGKGGGSVTVKVEEKEEKEEKKKEEKNTFDSEKILENFTTTPYTWNTEYENCLALVIKNNSTEDCELDVEVTFKDAEGAMLGVKENSIDVLGAGGEICVVFENEESFANYEYEYSVRESEYYVGVNKDLYCEAVPAKDKVIVSATNNGENVAEWVTATALFMQGDDVIGVKSVSIGDSDYEIKAGEKETEEIHFYDGFDGVNVYLSGYAEKPEESEE